MVEAQQASPSSGDATKEEQFVVVQEGKAKIGFHGPVFYNPVQEFNRDLTWVYLERFSTSSFTEGFSSRVCVLREFVKSRIANGAAATDYAPDGPKAKKAKMLYDKEVLSRSL